MTDKSFFTIISFVAQNVQCSLTTRIRQISFTSNGCESFHL